MYCISCLLEYPLAMGECPECRGELFDYEPGTAIQMEIEKRHYLLEVLKESETQGIINAQQRHTIAQTQQADLLRMRTSMMEELGLFDDEPEEDAPALNEPIHEVATPEDAQLAEQPEQAIANPASVVENDKLPSPIVHTEETAQAAHYDKLRHAFGTNKENEENEVAAPEEAAGEADILEVQEAIAELMADPEIELEADPLSMPDFEEDVVLAEDDEVVLRESAWSKYLKPFLVQNWLYFLGTFLVLASGFYLLSLAWEGMNNILRQSVIWGGLGTTALAFSGGGAYLHRRLGVDQAGQIFWLVGAGLLGSSAIAAGQASQHSTPIFLLLLAATLGIGLWLVRLLKPFDQGISRKLTASSMTGQLLLIGLIPVLKQNTHAKFWIFSFFYIGGILLWQTVRQLRATLRTDSGGAISLLLSLRPARDSATGNDTPGRWDWILFVGPVAYLFLLMIGWAGWEMSTVLQKRMALAWYGPLMVLIGSALLEFVFAPPPGNRDESTEETEETTEPEKEQTVSSWVGGAIGMGVLGMFIALPHPPAQLFAALAMCLMCLYIGVRWEKQGVFFLAGLGGLSAYVGCLRTIGIQDIWSATTINALHGTNGLLFLPFLALLFSGIVWLGKTQRHEGVKALRGLFLILSLALFGIMVLDVNQSPQSLMWGAPLYALAFLSISHINQKKGLAYIGVLMAGFWFGYGPTQWFDLPSKYALSMVFFAVVCFVTARLFEAGNAEGKLRQALDEAFYLALPATVYFWLQDPLFRFFQLEKALRGAGGGPWQPQGVWMCLYVGLIAYGVFMLWSTRNNGNPLTAYLSLSVIAVGAGLLGVATPRWLGRPIVPWRAPMFATLGAFALFEISRRLKMGVRPIDKRLSLFGFVSNIASEKIWTQPSRQGSYVLLFASLVLVGLRDLTVTTQLVFAYALTAFVVQAGVRQRQTRFGYLFCGMYWLLGFLQLSWVDESTKIDPTLAYIIFFGGGCLLLSGTLWLTRRWTSPEGETTHWTAIAGPSANMLPIFLGIATLWQLEQSWQWLAGKHPNPGYIFLGWMVLTLSFYSLASILRLAIFVHAGALSFVGMCLLAAQKWWSPLELLCASTGFFAFIYAIGILGIWRRFHTRHHISGLWSIYRPAWARQFRSGGYELWSRGHRDIALSMSFWSIPGLFFTWMVSLYISTGSEVLHLKAVDPWVVFTASLLAGFPFLWEGYITRKHQPKRAQRRFVVSLFAVGMGVSLGSSSLLKGFGLDPEAAVTWAIMMGLAAVFYQGLMWFCRFRQPGMWRIFETPVGGLLEMQVQHAAGDDKLESWWTQNLHLYRGIAPNQPTETVALFNIWGRLWKVAHGWFYLTTAAAIFLSVIALLNASGKEYAFLALLFIPLALEQFQRPSRSVLLMTLILGITFWGTKTLPMGWSTAGIVFLSCIFLWKSLRQWDNVPLRSLFWLSFAMAAVGFGCCIAILEPMPDMWQEAGYLSCWSIALSLVAMAYQGWMWFCRKRGGMFPVEDDFTLETHTAIEIIEPAEGEPEEASKRSPRWENLRDKGPWEGLYFASLSCFGMAAMIAGIATYSAYVGATDSRLWLLCLLPFLAAMPWGIDQLQRRVKGTILPAALLTSYGIYLTSGLAWKGTTAQWYLPVFVVGMGWILIEQLIAATGESSSTRRQFFSKVSFYIAAPVMLMGLFIWLSGIYDIRWSVYDQREMEWLLSPWAQIGVPLMYAWFFLRHRKSWIFHTWMLVWFAWPIGIMQWLFPGWNKVTPGLMWANWTLGLGLLAQWARRPRSPSDAIERSPQTLRDAFHKQRDMLAHWASIMGIFGFWALVYSASTAQSRIDATQWFVTAAMITVGWSFIALNKGTSSRWLLQASLAGTWCIHGLILLFIPAKAVVFGIKEPGLFALLSAVFVLLSHSMTALLERGRMAWLWKPVYIRETPVALRQTIHESDIRNAISRAFTRAAVLQNVLASILVVFAWTVSNIYSNSSSVLTTATIIGTLLLLAWNWVRIAVVQKRELPAYLGVLSFFGLYGFLRARLGIGSAKLDTWLLMIIGFLAVGFRVLWQRMGGDLLQRVIFKVSFVLPAIVWVITSSSGESIPAGFWMLAGLFYGVIAYQFERRLLYIPALLLVNVEFFRLLSNVMHADPFTNPQWYALPLGFTLFAFSAIYAKQLSQTGRNALRNIGAVAIYGCSMYQVVALNNIFDIMVLAVLAIAGVFAGIMLQVRSYLYLGGVFLVLNVGLNVFRIGINDRIIGMIFLFVTGLLVLASAVFFNLKRDEILKKYADWREQISSWD